MANTKTAQKQIRSSYRKWLRNRYVRGQMRGALKQVRQAIAAGDAELAQSLLPHMMSQLDKAAKKDIIHKNKAARLKSRIMRQINDLQKSA